MLPKYLFTFFCSLLLLISFAQDTKTYLFAGNYTAGVPAKGLYVFEFNCSNGTLKEISHVNEITNPSFIALSPNGKYLYACTETKMPNEGSVSAFEIDSVEGRLTFINKQNSGGENPVYLSVHQNNRWVVNANYSSGNVSVFGVNQDGSLNPFTQLLQFSDSSINKTRQDKSHIHAAVFSPDCQRVFFPDLGADKIRVFKCDFNNSLPLAPLDSITISTVPGGGPRHLVFHPRNNFAYCIEELSGMIAVYAFRNGQAEAVQRVFSYSKIQNSYGSSDIHISPDGLFLYASNRWDQENTISVFAIDQHNGKLILAGHESTYGDHPRSFVIDPSGKFLLVANLVSNTIVVFKRDLKTGLLQYTGNHIGLPAPACLKMRTYSTKSRRTE